MKLLDFEMKLQGNKMKQQQHEADKWQIEAER
jgi:hypothetical protein